MSLEKKTETKSSFDIPIELTPPTDHPIIPATDSAQPTAASATSFSISLPPSVLAFVSVAPTVLGKPGILWFDIRANSVTLIAAGEHIGFSHHTPIYAPDHAVSFGVSADHLVSVVEYSRKAYRKNSLTITVDPVSKCVVVKPDAAFLSDNKPLAGLLIDLNGVASPDLIDIEAQLRIAGRRLHAWRLTGFFERPEPSLPSPANTGAPVPLGHRALQRCLADAHKILPTGKAKRRLLQLDRGHFYAGNDDVIFRYDLSSLAEVSCALTTKQLAPLASLLRLLPVTERSCFIADGATRLIRTERTTIALPAMASPHPAYLAAIFTKTPTISFQVNASTWQNILEGLGRGEAYDAKFLFFHGTLVPGNPASLEMESLNPFTGGQFNWGGQIQIGSNQPVSATSFLADLRAVQRAAARLVGDLTILIGPKSLLTIGTVKGSCGYVRSNQVSSFVIRVPTKPTPTTRLRRPTNRSSLWRLPVVYYAWPS